MCFPAAEIIGHRNLPAINEGFRMFCWTSSELSLMTESVMRSAGSLPTALPTP